MCDAICNFDNFATFTVVMFEVKVFLVVTSSSVVVGYLDLIV